MKKYQSGTGIYTEMRENAEDNFYGGQPANNLLNNSAIPADKIVETRRLYRQSFPVNRSQIRSENFLLAAQPDQFYVKLLPFLERISLKTDQNLYQNGEAVKFLYFPETAVISDFQILEDGRTIEIAMTGREGVTGLIPFLSQTTAINWTQAAVAGTALKINAEIMRREFNYSFKLQSMMFEHVSSYLNQISQRMVCSNYHSAEQRFCGWLMMIGKRFKKTKLPLTQEQIARSLGVHRPTISCIAKSLQRDRIIDYRRGNITIVDQQSLANTACDCHRQIDIQYLQHSL